METTRIDVAAATTASVGAQPTRVARRRPGGRAGLPLPVISGITIAATLAAWATITYGGWVKPLFLPPPDAILSAFGDAWNGDLDGATLGVHVRDSLVRVVVAFFSSPPSSAFPPAWRWARAASGAASSIP